MMTDEVTTTDALTVRRASDGWCVGDRDGGMVAGPFRTQADAWRWIDRRAEADLEMEETRRRISSSDAING